MPYRAASFFLALCLALRLAPSPSWAGSDPSPTPGSSPHAVPSPSPSPPTPARATVTPKVTASPRVAASVSPTPARSPLATAEALPTNARGSALDAAPDATIAAPRPRAFRTPIRDVPPPFVAPQGAMPEAPDAGADAESPSDRLPAARGATVTVVFRTIARTAIEGFDLLVTYPLATGGFAGSADHVECVTASGALLAANDRDDGTMRLLVASAQTLPSPLAISCRYELAPGARLDARAIGVRVGEVSANGAAADASLLTVGVDVR